MNSHANPPAPKAPRCESSGAELIDSNNPLFTGTAICTFCRSSQHRPNAPFRSFMAATWAPLGVNFGQQGPNFGPKFGPNFSTTWLQLRPNLGSSLGAGGTHREAIRIQMQGTTNARKPTRIPAKSLYKESVVPI